MPSFRLKRGNTAQVAAYTGSAGELIYNTETGNVVVMDGATAGGNTIAGGGGAQLQGVPSGITLSSDAASSTFPGPPSTIVPMGGQNYAQNSTKIFFVNGSTDLYEVQKSDFVDSNSNWNSAFTSQNTVTHLASDFFLSTSNNYMTSVAATDTHVVVGDQGANNFDGAAGIYDLSNGNKYELVRPVGSVGAYGNYVAINDTYAYVGASDYMNPGQVHVFQLDGTFVRTITLASAGTSFAGYDASGSNLVFNNVAANNSHLIVVHDSYPNSSTDIGGVFVFSKDGSTFNGYIPNPSTTGNQYTYFSAPDIKFGVNNEDVCAIAHSYWVVNNIYNGALVFVNLSTLTATLSPNPNPNSTVMLSSPFGNFVSVYNDTVQNKDYFYSVDLLYTTPGMGWPAQYDGKSFIHEYDDTGTLVKTYEGGTDDINNSLAGNTSIYFVAPDPFYILGDEIVALRHDSQNSVWMQGFGTFTNSLSYNIVQNSTSLPFPDKLSQLSNDNGFITSADIPTNISSFTNDSGFSVSGSSFINVNADGADIPAFKPVMDSTQPGQPFVSVEEGAGETVAGWDGITYEQFTIEAQSGFTAAGNIHSAIDEENQVALAVYVDYTGSTYDLKARLIDYSSGSVVVGSAFSVDSSSTQIVELQVVQMNRAYNNGQGGNGFIIYMRPSSTSYEIYAIDVDYSNNKALGVLTQTTGSSVNGISHAKLIWSPLVYGGDTGRLFVLNVENSSIRVDNYTISPSPIAFSSVHTDTFSSYITGVNTFVAEMDTGANQTPDGNGGLDAYNLAIIANDSANQTKYYFPLKWETYLGMPYYATVSGVNPIGLGTSWYFADASQDFAKSVYDPTSREMHVFYYNRVGNSIDMNSLLISGSGTITISTPSSPFTHETALTSATSLAADDFRNDFSAGIDTTTHTAWISWRSNNSGNLSTCKTYDVATSSGVLQNDSTNAPGIDSRWQDGTRSMASVLTDSTNSKVFGLWYDSTNGYAGYSIPSSSFNTNISQSNFVGFSAASITHASAGRVLVDGDILPVLNTGLVSSANPFDIGSPVYLTATGTLTKVAADGLFPVGTALSHDTFKIKKPALVTEGGTGLSIIGSPGDLLIVNSNGDGYEFVNELDLGTLP